MRAFDSDCHSFTVQAEMLTGAHINDKYSLALSRRTNKQRHIWYVLLLVIVCTAQHQLEYEQKKANNNIKKPNETTNTQHWWNEVHNNDIDVLCWQLLQSAIITSCLLWYVIWDIIGSIHAGICARNDTSNASTLHVRTELAGVYIDFCTMYKAYERWLLIWLFVI